MKKGIIFDMDGTLWDSAANVAESWNLAIKQDGSVDKKLTEQDIQGVMGKTMDVIADILFPELEKEARMKLLDQCCSMENDYLREHGGVLYPKLEETLSELKEKYPLYIVSNCQSGYIEAFLDHYGFRKYFEDIECYGNNLKQKGDNIRLLADRNGLTEAVYVGDIQGDYDASCHAGVGFIHAAYGFGTIAADVPEIHTFEELTETAKVVGAEVFGDKFVLEGEDELFLSGDNAYRYFRETRGLFTVFLAGIPGENHPLHHPKFQLDERILPYSVEALYKIITTL